MRRLLVFSGFTCLLVFFGRDVWAGEVENKDVIVDANVVFAKDLGQINMSISLESKRPRPLFIRETQLPWGNWSSIVLSIVEIRGGKVLSIPVWPLEGIGAGKVKLQQGRKLQGVFSLTERFPKLKEINEKADVILFWSFQLDFFEDVDTGRAISDAEFERIGGWLVIPQSK